MSHVSREETVGDSGEKLAESKQVKIQKDAAERLSEKIWGTYFESHLKVGESEQKGNNFLRIRTESEKDSSIQLVVPLLG
jgi:hypothetical protein